MPDLHPELLHRLAHLGAAARLSQLEAEIAAIHAAFPALARGTAKPERKPRGNAASATMPVEKPAAKAKNRYRMSPAERKAVSARMKAYWQARREAKEQQKGEQAAAAVEAANDVQAPKPRGARLGKAAKDGRRAKKR